MAQSTKSNNTLSLVIILIYAILPIVYVKTLVDNTLIPHQLFASVGIIVLALLMFTVKGIKNLFPTWALVSYTGFVLVNVVAVSAAINPVEGWATVSRFMVPLAMFASLLLLFQSKKIEPQHLIKGVMIFGSIASVITLFQLLKALGSGDFISNIYVVSGSFSHKNLLSSALMLSLPFGIMGAMVLEKGWKNLGMVLTFLLIAEIFVLRTRGVWLGVFVSAFVFVLLFFVLRKKQLLQVKFPIKYIAVAAGLAVVVLVGLFSATQVSDDVSSTTNLENRFVFWNNSLEMIKEHPVLGVGPGNWKINFPKYGLAGLENSVLQGVTQVQRPHNDYLWVLTEGGPLALIFFLGIFVMAFWRLAGNFKQPLNKTDLAIDMAAGFGLLAYLIFSLTDFPLERTSHNLIVVALLALIFRNVNQDTKAGFAIPAKVVVAVVLGLAAFSTLVSANRWNGEKASVEILEYNRTRNAQRIVPTADAAINGFYNMDNFANPIRYYSALGRLVTNRTGEALRDGQESYEIAPYNVVVVNQMGNIHRALKDPEKALEYYHEATEISSLMEAARMSAAEIYLEQGDYISAYGEMRFLFRQTKGPRYQNIMQALLPPLVANFEEHGEYGSLVMFIRERNPRSAEQMLQIYRQFGSGK